MIRITRELTKKIEVHGRETYPDECCGILLGKDDDEARLILDIAPLENHQTENRRRRFFVTPGQYLEAERAASERGMELLGFYHSHPDHPAIPSEFDREHALPWFTYIVLSVVAGNPTVMTSWVLSDSRERFLERHLAVEIGQTGGDGGRRKGRNDVEVF